jgi:hypothetical protein
MDREVMTMDAFGSEHFGAAELGDRRRTRALVRCADQVHRHPTGTLPDKFANPAQLKCFYRLMNNKQVTHAAVLKPHRQRTLELARSNPGVTLFIHDDTHKDYTGLGSLQGELGPIGNGSQRGYICHNVLAVNADRRETLGLAHQQLHKRPRRKRKQTREQARRNPKRESRLWKKGSQAVPAAPPGRLWIEVADRGADLMEFLDHVQEQNKHYLVRSYHNRSIVRIEADGQQVEDRLHDYARRLPLQSVREITVPASDKAPARTARVRVAWAQVTLQPPRQPRGEERGVPLETWVVRVAECDPPEGVAPVEWILVTNVPVESASQSWRTVEWYAQRWIIEEYHKAEKTGMGVENLQFTTEAALQPAIAFLSVQATALLQLRDASRDADAATRPASGLFPLAMIVALALWRYEAPRTDLSVHEFFYALARLGGHQNRKGDGPPGWLVLWRGWTKLQSMTVITNQLPLKQSG